MYNRKLITKRYTRNYLKESSGYSHTYRKLSMNGSIPQQKKIKKRDELFYF
ncbi:hypothetical protein HMPREF9554_02254 [Treponema phagedenis F0421]|nr:hypothetical protein HMPREF9554_02254 [Treponema phagedenis F0421]